MNLSENIRIAVFSIKTNLMRSLLTMLGIIIGVSSVIAIITVGNGGRDYIVSMIEDMGSSAVSITMNSTASSSEFISRDDVAAIKEIESISYVSPIVYSIGSISTKKTDGMALMLAGTPDFQKVMNVNMKYGRFFTEEEYQSGTQVCVVPPMSATALFGYENCVGETVSFSYNDKTISMKVIGICDTLPLADTGDYASIMGTLGGDDVATVAAIITPSTVADAMMDSDGYYEMIYLMATDDGLLDDAGNSAKNLLYARHGNFGNNAYVVANMATYINLLDRVINLLTTIVAGISAISLVVGGIGVMNIMLVSVTERTREIGIRKALGAKTSTIMFQFLTESVILCLIGGLIGLILGVAGAVAVSALLEIPIDLQFKTFAIAIGFSSAIGIFFGIYPAKRAAQMLPIEALRRD